MPESVEDREIGLSSLVAIERWQRVQDRIAEGLAVGLRTVTPHRTLLVNPSWSTTLQGDRLTALLHLGDELEELLPPQALPTEIVTIVRPLGVSFSAVPLRASNRIVAYFVLGPIIVGRRQDADSFRAKAAERGLEAEAIWSLLLTIKNYTFGGLRAVAQFLEEVGNTVLELAEQSRSLRALMSGWPKVDEALLARLFQALLETATMATEAEGGSVMVFDDQRQALQIKASQGLSDEIIERTSIRQGEGLAGLAALRQSILLLDAQTQDASVKRRMQREDVVSAVVAPITPEASPEPMGVLNLRTSNPRRQFTDKDIELLKRLLHLTSIALTTLQYGVGPAKSSPPAV